MNRTIPTLAMLLVATVSLMGCDPAPPTPAPTAPAPATDTKTDTTAQTDTKTDPKDAGGTTGSSYDSSMAGSQLSSQDTGTSAPAGTISVDGKMPKNGDEVAVLETGMGKIVVMFFPQYAPNHVKNFKELVRKGFYVGTRFHRIVPGFMIQGGDPNTKKDDRSTWGQGDPGYKVGAEFNNIHHSKGVLSMARASDPNSAGSQFFLMVGDAPFLDHQYSAFGRIVIGQDVADKIVAQPADGEMAVDPVAIKKASIVKWPVN